MNHAKIILVAFISAFVAITTVFLGVTGTIIGSVLSSVLYNVFLEVLEKPIENAKISPNFEWDIAYAFPLVVILIIQFISILAHMSGLGLLPNIFMNMYLSIQGVADYNLYRILGLSLVVMCVYPFVLRRNYVKKSDGLIILFVGLMFLLRGFSDIGGAHSSTFSHIYSIIGFPIALISFVLLAYVVHSILSSAKNSNNNVSPVKINNYENLDDLELKQVHHQRRSQRNFDDLELKQVHHQRRSQRNLDDLELKQVHHQRRLQRNSPRDYPRKNNHNSPRKINKSSNDFQFESNDLLDDFKK